MVEKYIYESAEQIEQVQKRLGVTYWDRREGCETLNEEDFNEAVSMALTGEIADGDSLTIYGYTRMMAGLTGDSILEDLLCGLLCEMIDDNGEPELPAEAVELAEKLAECINTKWEPWACECTVEIVVDLKKWEELSAKQKGDQA
jgi:hypothetical protein